MLGLVCVVQSVSLCPEFVISRAGHLSSSAIWGYIKLTVIKVRYVLGSNFELELCQGILLADDAGDVENANDE